MLGLPKSTEVSKQLPKKAIYTKFNMNTSAKESFDKDVSRIMIVNEISPDTTTIEKGKEISSIYVLLISLKQKDFKDSNITQISKRIKQKMILVLSCGDEIKLAIFHNKLIQNDWQPTENCSILLIGRNLDEVWDNIVIQIGGIQVEHGHTLDEQIAADERQLKLLSEINRLDKQARSENQPKKKFELVQVINKLKKELEDINHG